MGGGEATTLDVKLDVREGGSPTLHEEDESSQQQQQSTHSNKSKNQSNSPRNEKRMTTSSSSSSTSASAAGVTFSTSTALDPRTSPLRPMRLYSNAGVSTGGHHGEVGTAAEVGTFERLGDWIIQPLNCFFVMYWVTFLCSGSVAIWGAVDVSDPPKTFLFIWDPKRMVEANLQCVNLMLAMCAVAQHPSRILDTKYWLVDPKKLTKRFEWYVPSRHCSMGLILLLLHAACFVIYASCIILWFTPRTPKADHSVAVLIPIHLALQIIPTLWSMLLSSKAKGEGGFPAVPPTSTPPMTPDRSHLQGGTPNKPSTTTGSGSGSSRVKAGGGGAGATGVVEFVDIPLEPPEHELDEKSPVTKSVPVTGATVAYQIPASLTEVRRSSTTGVMMEFKAENSSATENRHARTYTIKGKTFTIVWDDVWDWLIEWKNLLNVIVFLLVVVTGTMLFFAFIFIIPFKDSAVKMDFIESNAQILNMIFTVAAIANHPVRTMDTYYFLTHKTARLQKRYPWYVESNLEVQKAMRKVLIFLQGNCFGQYLMDLGMWSRPMCCRWIPVLALGLPASFVCGIVGGVLTEKYKRQFAPTAPPTAPQTPHPQESTNSRGVSVDLPATDSLPDHQPQQQKQQLSESNNGKVTSNSKGNSDSSTSAKAADGSTQEQPHTSLKAYLVANTSNSAIDMDTKL